MEFRAFVEEALKDVLGAVEDAQRQVLRGEIVPNRGDGKQSDIDVEFEVTVKADEHDARLIVVAAAAAVAGAKPPGAPTPAGGGPPPPPYAGKLKFKIPVRLPAQQGCILSRLIEHALCTLVKRRRKRKRALAGKEALAQLPKPPEMPAELDSNGELKENKAGDDERKESGERF